MVVNIGPCNEVMLCVAESVPLHLCFRQKKISVTCKEWVSPGYNTHIINCTQLQNKRTELLIVLTSALYHSFLIANENPKVHGMNKKRERGMLKMNIVVCHHVLPKTLKGLDSDLCLYSNN